MWAVIGNLGDSQCYLGVTAKVQAVQAALHRRIAEDDLGRRLIPPAFTLGVSDGSSTARRMRFSLVGRELVHDVADVHLAPTASPASSPSWLRQAPRRDLAAVLENDMPGVILSDGPIRPGIDPETGEPIDLVSAFQVADHDPTSCARYALNACPARAAAAACSPTTPCRRSSRSSARAAAHGVAAVGRPPPARRLPRPDGRLPPHHDEQGIRPRDIVTPASLRNAMTVAIAMGGSTNVRAAQRQTPAPPASTSGPRAEPGRLQRAGPPAARARQHAALRRVLHGRRGRQRWPAGDREGTARRRLPRRGCPDLHGRDAGRAGPTSRPPAPDHEVI